MKYSILLIWLVLFTLLAGSCTAESSPDDLTAAYEGSELEGPAVDFSLVDQAGLPVRLSDFRDKLVVLTFMDSQCQEVCPLTSAHLRTTSQALGPDNSQVIFIGINVNLAANSIQDVAAATQKWQLDEIPNWHFLTGSAEELEPIWKSYDVAVVPASQEEEELLHTPGVYLIDQNGEKRWYISTPFDEAGSAPWTPPLSDLLVEHIQELLGER